LRIGPSGTLLIVLGLAAVALPPLALWVDNEGEQDLLDAREAEREVSLAALGAIEAETGLRGYILTADEAFRGPYDIGVAQLSQSASRLREVVPEDVAAAVEQFVDAFEEWRREAAEPRIQMVQQGNLEEARSTESAQEGRLLFDRVRTAADALSLRARGNLNEAEGNRDEREVLQLVLVGAGGVCLAGFAGMVAFVFSSRRKSQVELGAMRRELASERELSVRSKEILATASHELRNPLAGLLLSAQVLEEEAQETGHADLAMMGAEMAAAARRAADLVTELLDFTRYEAGRMQLAKDEVVPEAVVQRAVEDVRLSYTDADIAVDTEAEAPKRVTGDFARLRLVVRNLLENAYRYGAPPLRVRITDGGREVEIHVEDSGPGIPSNERESVFERYTRGTTAQGRDGTGIGLYVSKGIVELHGGSIRVESSPLGGADFVVALPHG
jgi:signal transduction histidine kinase